MDEDDFISVEEGNVGFRKKPKIVGVRAKKKIEKYKNQEQAGEIPVRYANLPRLPEDASPLAFAGPSLLGRTENSELAVANENETHLDDAYAIHLPGAAEDTKPLAVTGPSSFHRMSASPTLTMKNG
ncbi:hypothetical protein CBL_20350 [Carabus blaptoides fortunei]